MKRIITIGREFGAGLGGGTEQAGGAALRNHDGHRQRGANAGRHKRDDIGVERQTEDERVIGSERSGADQQRFPARRRKRRPP